MPKRGRSGAPERARIGELAHAKDAFRRLIECLELIDRALANGAVRTAAASKSGHRRRRLTTRYRSAAHALGNHAQFVVAEFAFIDGERVDHAHDRLLSTFYANPDDGAASRYCWAILREVTSSAVPLARLRAAITTEHEVFTQDQEEESYGVDVASDGLAELIAMQATCQKRADRLSYTLAILKRLLLVTRYLHGQSDPTVQDLEAEVAEVLEAAEEAHRHLRTARLRRLGARRSSRR